MKQMFLEYERMIKEVYGEERIRTKEMRMYKGTVKKW